MRRLSAATSILAISLLMIGGLASATVAKDDSLSTATSPAVGTWLLTIVEQPTAPPTLMTIHADGTYLQWDTAAAGIGSWEATGPNTGALSYDQYGLDDTGAIGHTTVRATFEVAPDGNNLTAAYTVEYVGADGSDTGEMGPGTAMAVRIPVSPMGTPAMPLGGPAPSPAA